MTQPPSPFTLHPSPKLGKWPKSSRRMGIGFMMPIAEKSVFGPPIRFSDMLQMALVAEAAGYDALWLADHFLFRPPVADEGDEYGVWEAFTVAAALAQGTTTINIGLLVSCLGWRNPGLVAKMTETIDEVSGGRFILGVGAGWHEPEYDAFGFPFDHRVGRFEDAVTIIGTMLRDGRADHDGRFFAAANAVNRPRGPLGAAGGAPILVGSSGARMLRIMAAHADAWNTVWHKEAAAVEPLLAAVDDACREVGRDPATLVRTVGGNIALPGYTGKRRNPIEGDNDAIAATIAGFRDLGLRHFVAGIDPGTPHSLEQFARVVELLDRSA